MEQNSPPLLPEPSLPALWISKARGVSPRAWFTIALSAVLLATLFLFLFRIDDWKLKSRNFSEVNLLVPEKISQSAAIVISLPKGISIDPAQAAAHITFEPPIDGQWLPPATDNKKDGKTKLAFKPEEPLELGKYYSVTVTSSDKAIQGDFLADEDPAVVAIFPNENSEAPETSSITIIFNRPMVPLTTLDTLDEMAIPVEIIPQTAGKFKWITTRNLQFIPETRLNRSTNYSVRVKEGFVSMDGLSVAGLTHTFRTRHLRYEHIDSGQIGFSEPIHIRFNQPVDIEKTKQSITVTKALGTPVPILITYGTRSLYNHAKEKDETFIDKSVIEVYQAEDSFGRDGLWDFATTYQISITGASPLDGDIPLSEIRKNTVSVPEVITALSADSARSSFVEPDLFDPQGTLAVSFAEPVDKEKSELKAKALVRIDYGEKCKELSPGERVYYDEECKKVPDEQKLILSFDGSKLGKGESVPIRFEKIVSKDGLRLNSRPLTRTITTYPELIIYKTTPMNTARGADLTKLVVCTSNPLTPSTEENFTDLLKSNFTVGLWNWHPPFRVPPGGINTTCAPGQFENTILYGLVPEYPYRMTLRAVDDFNQQSETAVSFTSGKIAQKTRQFFHLNKRYNVTSPHKTKITYAVENLEYVNLNICSVTPQTMLRYHEAPPKDTTAPSSLPCISSETHRIELPKQYWTRNYFHIDLKEYFPDPRGHFVLSFSHPEYRRLTNEWDEKTNKHRPVAHENIYERTFLTITNLAVAEKKVNLITGKAAYYADAHREATNRALAGDQNLYWVTEFNSLVPRTGAAVALYDLFEGGVREVTSAKTDAQGIARTKAVENLLGAVVTEGSDSAIVTEHTDRLQWASWAQSSDRTYIYTDRPIYRPGQEVFIKGIYREGYDASYEIPVGKKSTLEIQNSRGEKISAVPVTLNEYGTFTAHTLLDTSAPLGTYSFSAFGGYGIFDVEEYVPAAFKVDVRPDKEEYIAGDTMRLTVDADYYFGVPAEEGSDVIYTITSQQYFFDRYTDGAFNFGGDWYYDPYEGYGDRFLLRGNTKIGANGEAIIEQLLDFETLFKEEAQKTSKIFVLNITVKNRNGQSVSSQKSLIVHRGEFYLDVRPTPRFLGVNDSLALAIKSVDTRGGEIAVRDATLEIKKITWRYFKRREVDGGYYYHSERQEKIVDTLSFKTDREGNWSTTRTLEEEGQYEIIAQAVDERGNTVRAVSDVYVHGPREASVQPTNNETLELKTETNKLDTPGTGRFTIVSPYPRAKALVTLERGKIFSYDIVDIDRNFFEYTFPVQAEYIPNVYASVLLLSPNPEIKYGKINFQVNTSARELDITVTPNKRTYLPGESVTLSITARDKSGTPVEAELSLAVADLSVLALKGNPKKNPIAFFFAGEPHAVLTSVNVKNILEEKEIPSGTKGGGGGSPEDLARRKRGIFKDTALWEGVVRTDRNGAATVTFTLPDNLTTWQIESVGVTKDTKLGAAYEEFTARKDVMIVPLLPRFIVPGDEFMIGAKIFNQTDGEQTLDVTLDAPSLEILEKPATSVRLKKEEIKTLYFAVRAPQAQQSGSHTFVLSAKNPAHEDTVEQSIPITRNDTYEAVATANVTGENRAREYVYLPENIVPDRGGLTVNVSATLAVFLSDALNYLASYPYGCSEQIASKLSSIATVKRGLNLENVGDKFNLEKIIFDGQEYTLDDVVEIGLARIYENQTTEGGMSYYKRLLPNFHLTLHVVNTLTDLKAAGYSVRNDVLLRAGRFLVSELARRPELARDNDTVILTAYAISRVSGLEKESAALQTRVETIARDTSYIQEKIGNIALTHLAILLARGYSSELKETVYTVLENRIAIDGRGAFLAIGGNPLYQYYETPIKDTALLLKAFAADKRESPVIDKALRWLLQSRAKDGAWGSTNNTAAVVDAMTDFLSWKKETTSDFSLSLTKQGEKIQTFDFNPKTILETFSAFLPISAFAPATIETVEFNKTNRKENAPNTFYYDLSLKYYLPIDTIPPRDEGFTVERELYRLDDETFKTPVQEARVGEVLRGRLTISVSKPRSFVSLEDYIPAGMELVNLKLATEDQSIGQLEGVEDADYYEDGYSEGEHYNYDGSESGQRDASARPFTTDSPAKTFGLFAPFRDFFRPLMPQFLTAAVGSRRGLDELDDVAYSNRVKQNLLLRPSAEELHDDRLFLFNENLAPGVYTYEYFVRALIPGTYHHLPAVVSEMYFPENFGRTRGEYFRVVE